MTLVMLFGGSSAMRGQGDDPYLTRYVATQTTVGGQTYAGSYSNTGLSWQSPKANIQDAINDLHEYMVAEGKTSGGRVYVASGTYTPTESTETSGGTTFNLSFKVYAGITLYGGFDANAPESKPSERKMTTRRGVDAGTVGSHTTGQFVRMTNPTILSGNLNTNRRSSLTWSKDRQSYSAVMPGNVYHVVTFATNGFNGNTKRANALDGAAEIDGFTIQHGNAGYSDASERSHAAYGGGVYAVGGATIRNCEIKQCSATRDGGGVYCDGGGQVVGSYIHTCQAVGIGIQYGNGGGVMLDGGGVVNTSVLANNYAREGGGLSMTDANALGNNGRYNYKTSCSATLIVNNTAASEGGGVYMSKGGSVNNVSVYRNRCNGTGITINGRTNGQSAGLFAGPMSRIYNSVLWGGNIRGGGSDDKEVQYATSAGEGDERSRMYYTRLSRHDLTDWTYTYKKNVKALEADNEQDGTRSGNYIALKNPSQETGVVSDVCDDDTYITAYDWQPNYYSSLAAAGVQLKNIPLESGVTHDTEISSTDVRNEEFSPDTDLGALVSTYESAIPATGVPYVEDPAFTGTVYTIFVDPNRKTGVGNANNETGNSWDSPLRNVRRALALFQSWQDSHDAKWDVDAYRYQVLVKEGTLYTPISVGTGNIRENSWWLNNHVAVYGGYPTANTGTSTAGRNPNDHQTILSGNSMGDDYRYAAPHLVQIGNVTGAILDGFVLTYANAASSEQLEAGNYDNKGAAIWVRNDRTMQDPGNDAGWGVWPVADGKRISMDNTIRNCVISNCGAADGAAIYVDAEAGTTSTLRMENCIVRNNGTNFDLKGDLSSSAIDTGKNPNIISVGRNATLEIDHCDVLKNVGHGIVTKDGGQVHMTNTMLWANLDRPVDETADFNNLTSAKLVAPVKKIGSEGGFTGNNNLFDALTLSGTVMWTDNTGLTDDPATSENKAIFDYAYHKTLSATYPGFENPTSNCGIVSGGGDITYYGGEASFMPNNMNPMVNAGSTSGTHGATSDQTWGTDIRQVNRDFGGLPDIGAVENNDVDNGQQPYGTILYVRDYRLADGTIDYTTEGDGSSWRHAINGNAQYSLEDGSFVGETATPGTTTTGLQYAVNRQSKAFTEAGGTKAVTREVWVGAGTYQKDNETVGSADKAYGFALEADKGDTDKSCFVIRDGVTVLGGFPREGNPTKTERQALVSNYVKVITGYEPADYETILQPTTKTIEAGATRRVLGQPNDYNPVKSPAAPYVGATWDGFTLRQGVLDAAQINDPKRGGGAGAVAYKNVTLRNMVVTNNTTIYTNASGTQDFRAGGVYLDGGTLEEGYVINNLLEGWAQDTQSALQSGAAYGGGMYAYSGTVYNSVVANNRIWATYADGAGIFIENANFFNNTIVNNKAEGTARACGGVAIWQSGSSSTLTVYNSIILNNEGKLSGVIGDKDLSVQNGGRMNLHNCITEDPTEHVSGSNAIRFYDCQKATMSNTLFVIPGNYLERSADGQPSAGGFKTLNLRLASTALGAINTGDPAPVIRTNPDDESTAVTYDLTTYKDMDYAERVQDCAIDIGAYEYNGALDISPDVDTEPGTAFFYLTQNGRGDRTGISPDNAACMQKIQKVLDAAGRYKYQNPGVRTIVKLAAVPATSGYEPQRRVDEAKDDPRCYSILVPRGVELWGGYSSQIADDDASDNGFNEDKRNVTVNRTVLHGEYNVDNGRAIAYHVVQFTDYVYDADGFPYTTSDQVGGTSSCDKTLLYKNQNLLLLSSRVGQEQAIVDGVFITGGAADAGGTAGSGINENQYGGAVIINEFGHVRNCILEDNKAKYGGAVYIEKGGVLSGSLLKNNTADYGGAIYVEQLDDDEANEEYPDEMAHVITCTVVNNTANTAGGGIWFYNNTRVNSSVFWHNECADQANVSGQTSAAYKGAVDENSIYTKFPFSYSAVQNARLAGTNNFSVDSESRKGVRFTDEDGATTPGYYGLDDYSVLNNVGMPNVLYEQWVTQFGVSDQDFASVYRVSDGSSFVDVGARSNLALTSILPTSPEQLLLRLYVAQPADVDYDLMQAMRNSDDAIYSKVGSSFAYPMQHLDEALEYIRNARKDDTPVTGTTLTMKDYAANLPFEIVMSRGTYFPQLDVEGNYGYSTANTFLIPEGVTLVGGMDCGPIEGQPGHYYGQNRKAKAKTATYTHDIYTNVEALTDVEVKTGAADDIEGGGEMLVREERAESRKLPFDRLRNQAERAPKKTGIYDGGSGLTGITMEATDIKTMEAARPKSDNNANGLYEPWEFKNQTVLSGRIVNVSSTSTVNAAYHVVTILADESITGKRPSLSSERKTTLTTGTENKNYTTSTTGTAAHEMGQAVTFDGIVIQDGQAYGYLPGAVTENGSYTYYHGGAILVDGNWYSELSSENKPLTRYMHAGAPQAVGYRDIPIAIKNCVFANNKAGYGGAISSNGTLHIYSSTFYQNVASTGQDTNVDYVDASTGKPTTATVQYAGVGGAIYVTKALTCINTLFANNESKDPLYDGRLSNFRSLRNAMKGTLGAAFYGGAGGAAFGGRHSCIQMVNCDFVKNKATLFPAIYTMRPNTERSTIDNYNEVLNSVFWGNEATSSQKFADMVINMARPDSYTASPSNDVSVASYPNILPTSQEEMNSFSPTIWFSAYEKGTAVTPASRYDLRNANYDLGTYIPTLLKNHATKAVDQGGLGVPEAEYTEQNNNVILSSDNYALNGPNFASPSIHAGADGYMASADWSLSRANNLVDNGWGRLDQTVTAVADASGDTHYETSFQTGPVTIMGDTKERFVGTGAYHSIHYVDVLYNDVNYERIDKTPLGNEQYMYYVAEGGAGSQVEGEMYRISSDPNPSSEQVYIDMGVYEYIHTELEPTEENEVDILWVSTQEKLENGAPDGSCWEQPTSNLQRAIETLLSSRNGHRKEIRITEGEYSPIYTMGDDKLLTFYVNTGSLNEQAEVVGSDQSKQYVRSLKISGGWSKDWKMSDDSERSIDEYPVVLRSQARSGVGTDKLNALFLVDDARQWYGVTNGASSTASLSLSGDVPAVVPITLDGLRLVNANALPGVDGSAFGYADQLYYTNTAGDISATPDATHTTAHEAAVPANGDLRLRLNHVTVTASGSTAEPAVLMADAGTVMGSAACVGKGGGDALIYNSLFHDNRNHPLKATNIRVVNCTFGQNQGIVQLIDSEGDETISKGETTGGSEMLAPEYRAERAERAESRKLKAEREERAESGKLKAERAESGKLKAEREERAESGKLPFDRLRNQAERGLVESLVESEVESQEENAAGENLSAFSFQLSAKELSAKELSAKELSAKKTKSYALGAGSQMHNSVLWRNNLAGLSRTGLATADGTTVDVEAGTQADGAALGNGTQVLFKNAAGEYWTPTSQKGGLDPDSEGGKYYAYTFTTSPKFTYNASSDLYHYNDLQYELHEKNRSTDAKENYGVSTDNSDAIYGPNFTDTEADEAESRDYHLLPSVRLMNSGDNDVYTALVGTNPTTSYTTVVSFDADKSHTTRETTSTSTNSDGSVTTTTTSSSTTVYNVSDKEGQFSGFETDLAGVQRVQAVKIDRGAYEYQEALTRVAYVDPSQRDGNGSSWAETYSSLQQAIDLVAVYYNTYHLPAYVFAKTGRMNENVIMRDGVQVYGSVPRSYNQVAMRNPDVERDAAKATTEQKTDDTGLIEAYTRQLRNEREGLAVPSLETVRSTINGLRNSTSVYTGVSLMDGFDIHGSSNEGLSRITAPVVNLTSATGKFVLRNCIVRDNIYVDPALTTPVVNIGSAALLYNVLFRNNATAGDVPLLHLGHPDAYALNISLHTSGNAAVDGTGWLANSLTWSTATNGTGVVGNTIHTTNNNTAAEGYPFARYLSEQVIYASYPNVWYQLTENSKHIDQCVQEAGADGTTNVGSATQKATLPADFAPYVDYATDRDVLGNPRRIATCTTASTGVDRGCFETWRIGAEHMAANPAMAAGETPVTSVATLKPVVLYEATTPTNNHSNAEDITSLQPFYPQTGSVVYVMPGSSLVLGEWTYTGGTPATATNPLVDYRNNGNIFTFRPFYLLMKQGASLYGQGNAVSLPYLSVERYFSNASTASEGEQKLYYNGLMALPFDFHYGDAPQKVTYAAATQIPALADSKDQPVYTYDGAARSAWDNIFASAASQHWTTLAGTDRQRTANEGVLFAPALAQGEEALYRFSVLTDNLAATTSDVYKETPSETSKTVTLTQHDDRESTAGSADFTSREDMGWNCIGLPYLIGDYMTGLIDNYTGTDGAGTGGTEAASVLEAITGEAPNEYMLHTPHALWLYYNDSNTYDLKNSWDCDDEGTVYRSPATVMSGEGFFTQTAAIAPTETLTFTLPIWFNQAGGGVREEYSAHKIPGIRQGGQITPDPDPDEASAAIRVYSLSGVLHVEGLTDHTVRIYDSAGRLHGTGLHVTGTYSLRVPRGTYIVRVGSAVWKVYTN